MSQVDPWDEVKSRKLKIVHSVRPDGGAAKVHAQQPHTHTRDAIH